MQWQYEFQIVVCVLSAVRRTYYPNVTEEWMLSYIAMKTSRPPSKCVHKDQTCVTNNITIRAT